jgi:hypothetical protein
MPGAQAVVWRDTYALATGTQKGSGTTITDRGKDFKSCGVRAGLAVKNTTASTSGHVVSVTEDQIVTDIAFAAGATYEIYKTTTYDSKLATHYEDKRAGRKVVNPDQTENGVLIEDLDLDEHDKNVFGPGQPWKD